jgi:hypothetical protein
MEYKVKAPVVHNGQEYKVGDTISDLTPDRVEWLTSNGAIEAAQGAPQAQPVAAPVAPQPAPANVQLTPEQVTKDFEAAQV